MGRAACFTMAERVAALRVAADVMQASQRARERVCCVSQGPNRLEALAIFQWPGVVRVSLRYTGELIAESQPGKPYVMALGLDADPSRNGMERFEHWANGRAVTREAREPGRAAWNKAMPSPLAEFVGEWLNDNAEHLVPPEHASAAIAADEFCGVRANDDDGYLEHYLVTEQAMTACVAAHGLPADCTAELHTSLAELVHTGHLERDMAWYVQPGIGKRLFYVLNAVHFE